MSFADIYQSIECNIDGVFIFETEATVTVEVDEDADSIGIVRVVSFLFEDAFSHITWDDTAGKWVNNTKYTTVTAESWPDLFNVLCKSLDMKRLQENLAERNPRKSGFGSDINDYHARVL